MYMQYIKNQFTFQEPIRRISVNYPKDSGAPFYREDGSPMPPLAKLIIKVSNKPKILNTYIDDLDIYIIDR